MVSLLHLIYKLLLIKSFFQFLLALILLNDYNTRLNNEMAERKKLTVMLKDFQREQQELLAQAEQRLEVCSSFAKIGRAHV